MTRPTTLGTSGIPKTGAPADQTRVTLDGEVVSLSGDDLDRVLAALTALDCHDAAAVAEQIAALRVAGGTIDLMPTEAEQDALRLAVESLARARGKSAGGLAALVDVCAEGGSALGVGAA